ncbi:ATP-binding protein [Actinoplanes sp. NPDC026619]|uniref:sensor histidine kinase n=1 Tax=Actinoplanes sp. NPDC026619 TaxID=3155798 RepID=UPI0033FEC85D
MDASAREASGQQGDIEDDVPMVRLCAGGLPDRAASNFAAVIARAARVPTAMIQLTDDGEMLRLFGAVGVPAEWAQIGRTPITSTMAGLVIGHEHPIIVADIADDPRVPPYAPARELGVRGYAGFPIRDPQQHIVGVCTVLDFQTRTWSPEELAAVDEGAQACTAFVAEWQARAHADTQRRFLDALLQGLRTGVAACDERGRLVFVNEVIHRLSGTISIGAPIQDWTQYSNVTDAQGQPLPGERLPLLRALRGEYLRDIDLTVTRPGGHPRTVSADAQPITGADGRRLGAVVTIRDVTEERRAARFQDVERTVLEALGRGDGLYDMGASVLASISAGFGWPNGELWQVDPDADALLLVARCPGSAPVADLAQAGHDVLTGAAWRTGKPVWTGDIGGPETSVRPEINLAVPAISGRRVLAVLSFAADMPDGPATRVVELLSGLGARIAEFLERRRAEELTLALARSRDEYLALVDHELRTPLTSIAAYVGMIRDADPATIVDDLPDLIDVLSRNSDTLRHIFDQLLDLAALDGGHAKMIHQPVDMAEIVTAGVQAAQAAKTFTATNLTVDVRADGSAHGDASRLRQMVDELIDNAVRHTPDDGDIAVVLTRPAATIVELTVTDTGIGIPADEQEGIFTRFRRSGRTREHRIPGHGLGLAISRAIVEGHRGSIQLASTEKGGTRVTVRLPVVAR